MFDDVKKGKKLNKKQSIKKQNHKLWAIKEKATHQKQNHNYEKLMNELENLKNNIKSTMLSTMQISNF